MEGAISQRSEQTSNMSGSGPAGMELAAGGGDVAPFAPADDDCVVAADQGFLKG